MTRINTPLFKRIYQDQALMHSAECLQVLLMLVKCANKKGIVNLHYIHFCKLLGRMDTTQYSHFYACIRKLIEAGYIAYNKNNDISRRHISVRVLGLKYSVANYINANCPFFNNNLFLDLKAGEIRTYLYLLYIMSHDQHYLNDSGTLLTDNTMLEELGIKTSSLTKYLKTLAKLDLIKYEYNPTGDAIIVTYLSTGLRSRRRNDNLSCIEYNLDYELNTNEVSMNNATRKSLTSYALQKANTDNKRNKTHNHITLEYKLLKVMSLTIQKLATTATYTVNTATSIFSNIWNKNYAIIPIEEPT